MNDYYNRGGGRGGGGGGWEWCILDFCVGISNWYVKEFRFNNSQVERQTNICGT